MILVVVAHADDETLGMGGTFAALAHTETVSVGTFTDGVSSRHDATSGQARQRKNHFLHAINTLARVVDDWNVLPSGSWLVRGDNGSGWMYGNFPDQRLDEVGLIELTAHVTLMLERFKPTVIYTHHPGDLNIDHRRVAEAVLVATRPGGSYPVKDVYAMEVPSSTEWTFGTTTTFTPNVFVNIGATLTTKLQAFQCYRDELRESPHPRSLAMLVARAAYWGSVSGYAYAEAFQLLRSLR